MIQAVMCPKIHLKFLCCEKLGLTLLILFKMLFITFSVSKFVVIFSKNVVYWKQSLDENYYKVMLKFFLWILTCEILPNLQSTSLYRVHMFNLHFLGTH